MPFNPCRLAVLISGTGTTMVNLHECIARKELPAQIAVVISSRKKVLGLERAQERGIPTRVLTRKRFRTHGEFDAEGYSRALLQVIEPFAPDRGCREASRSVSATNELAELFPDLSLVGWRPWAGVSNSRSISNA